MLIAVDSEFLRLAVRANGGAATLALLKIAVYEEDGLTRAHAIEPEKGVAQIRDPELNDRSLEFRKRFIKMIMALERPSAKAG